MVGVRPAARSRASSVKRELDARGAAADDRDARARGQRRDARVELVDEPRDRPRRERVLAHSRQVESAHGRADVEARDVVGERGTAVELDAVRRGIDRDRRRDHHPRARAAGQRTTSIASSCPA
jgi:hypothetical protein